MIDIKLLNTFNFRMIKESRRDDMFVEKYWEKIKSPVGAKWLYILVC